MDDRQTGTRFVAAPQSMSVIEIYQQLTRCETLTPYAETSLPRQRARSSSYVPFESQWLILRPIQPTDGKPARCKPRTRLGTLRVAFQMIPVL